MSAEQCQQARLSKDRRYDGLFFTAVKTTGIYCRPICPAPAPLERNVEYFSSAIAAANAGYRPCLRCRPDSAPGSPAWLGKSTTFRRAQRLIDEGALCSGDLPQLAARLGVSERYLRKLFDTEIGMSPKAYSLYRQCLLAKKLLHETRLPVTEIALACGFNSIRRFNDSFRQHFALTPTEVRRQRNRHPLSSGAVTVTLAYRPPYDWSAVRDFYCSRLIEGLEWVGENSYGRTFGDGKGKGHFTAVHDPDKSQFNVTIELDDITQLAVLLANIRRCLDLDADSARIESCLVQAMGEPLLSSGIRLPGIWSPFEAGVRAVLGQQVSVKAARNLVTKLVAMNPDNEDGRCYFPSPQQVADWDFSSLGMPQRRRDTLSILARFAVGHSLDDPAALLALPGIGPWTVNYLRMRGLSEPDIFLEGDLGVKKALTQYPCEPLSAAPWRSYLTLYLWSLLA
ncbi:ADA regulatory protein [Photobacterium aquae]|uniref:DNA-3-methyladenine glycosylase II n=1 Tax=Photobacterium aquae TaxID=1195763 RepID=A0A0J1HD43_9GAMM|nr:AlkA N-terminal domain-containing protein [Photobacterium aquae]KLV09560.1 ADA regulatory protein [Photobacterium aquae]